MKSAKIDLPVALIFFNRSETFEQVFKEVAIARPTVLFLIQDGPRKGHTSDVYEIKKCQEIASRIDWECKVYKYFSTSNLGCGKRISSGLSKAFEIVDRLVILEDDCVPSQNMFPFCDELLERYKDDERVNMISGMNHLGSHDVGEQSYFFCKTGSIWGWATWKRVWLNYDYQMSFMNDESVIDSFKNLHLPNYAIKSSLKIGKARKAALDRNENLTAWTFQFGMLRHLYSQLVIVPTVNLISNIGIQENNTHNIGQLKLLPRALRKIFYLQAYNGPFVISHPNYIIENVKYDNKVRRLMGSRPLISGLRRGEVLVRLIVYGNFEILYKKLKHKVKQRVFG